MNLKKFLCAVVSAVMMAASAVPVMAAETEPELVKVEFEDQPPKLYGADYGVADNDAASGSKWVQYVGAGNEASLGTCATTVNVSEGGFYELKFRGTKSDGSLSNLSFSANGAGSISLVGAAAAEEQSVKASWWSTKIYTQTAGTLIQLMPGENTITFNIAPRSQNDYYVVMDYYTVEKKASFPTVASDGKATIECEDFSPKNWIVANEKASGGKYAWVGVGNVTQYTLDTYVNVPKEGYYKIGVGAGERWSKSSGSTVYGSATHLSPIHVKTADKDVALTLDNTVRDNSVLNYGGHTNETVEMINLNDFFYLDEGVNKISIQCDIRLDKAGAYATLDCISLEAVGGNTVGTAGTTVLEAENIFGGGSNYDAASGGKYILNYNENTESKTLSGVIYAEQEGYYKLGYDGTNPSKSDKFMSPLSFSVNGEKLSTAVAGDFKYTSGYNSPWNVYSNSLSGVYLKKGKNTIEVTATRAEAFAQGTNNVFFVLDNITFENQMKTIGLSGGTIECENFSAESWVVENEKASGGKYAQVSYVTAPYTLDMYVNIETAGNYKIGVGASEYYGRQNVNAEHGTAQHLSKLNLIVGDNDILLGGENITRDSSKLYYPGFTGAMVEMLNLTNAIYLDAGINKISIQCGNAQNLGIAFATLDCVKLSYADTIPAEGGKLEIESGINGYTMTSSAASGGKYVAFDLADTSDDPTVDLVANTSAAGEYQLMIAAASNVGDAVTANLSSAQLVINNSDTYDVSLTNCIIAGDVYYLDSESKYPFRNYYLNTPVSLNEGVNKINIYPYADDEEFVRSAFDYIELIPIKNFGELTAASAETTMNVGDEQTMQILKADGSQLSNSDVYMITYSSDNEEVATIDGNGLIKANNGGETTITAVVCENAIGEAKTVSMTVKVNDGRQIFFSGINTENGISYNVVINSALNDLANVFTAVYDSDGKLVSAYVENISAGTTGVTPITASDAAIPTGGYAKLFVWTQMTPVLTTTIE